MELNELLSIGVIVVILGIVLTFGLQTQSEVRNDISEDCASGFVRNTSYAVDSVRACNLAGAKGLAGANLTTIKSIDAYNGGTESLQAVGKFASKQGLIVTAVIAVVIIGLLLRMFVFKNQG
jgi:uncharacterized membrane protein